MLESIDILKTILMKVCSLFLLHSFQAYRAFGSKLKILKNKLDELIPTLSDSPIPSPDVNAPSPSPDSDIELPNTDEKSYEPSSKHETSNNGFDFNSISSSFMGTSQFLDMSSVQVLIFPLRYQI